MRVERLVESRPAILELSLAEASGLVAAGRRLARSGGTASSADSSKGTPSVIECEPYGHGSWRVAVPNAVGVVQVDDLQLIVEPKVPLPHLLHLFERSGAFPRLDASIANLSSAQSLWPLVASWYIVSLEQLLRSGLASGFELTRDSVPAVRGRVLTASSARSFLKGRVLLDCEFEEFSVDTPLNRTLKAAARSVATSAALGWSVRRRASNTMNHMEGVGQLRQSDSVDAQVERHTSRYEAPMRLARHVLSSTGRGIETGEEHGHAFLIRTPEMVEEGLRRIVAETLADTTNVTKRTRFLSGSHHSLTPDLAFGHVAIGDVKYKLWLGDWDRGDLYQLVAFATGFVVRNAVRLGFAVTDHGPSTILVGPVVLKTCDWRCDATVAPTVAEDEFRTRVREWWESVVADSGGVSDGQAEAS